MFFNTRTRYKLCSALVAFAANACAIHGAEPVETASAPLSCAGGTIRNATDAALYSACEHVNGDLRISSPELTNLSPLARLRSVAGKLEISENPQLDDLSGLERLEHVAALSIRHNPELDDLSALSHLSSAESIVISDNPELGHLRGLEGLTQLDMLVLEHNGLYQTVGLSGLTQVGTLVVQDNPRLNSLRGLKSLAHARSIEISENPLLSSYGLLPALKHVDRELLLSRNRGLSTLEIHQLLGRVDHRSEPHETLALR
jgi:hypothetical protein